MSTPQEINSFYCAALLIKHGISLDDLQPSAAGSGLLWDMSPSEVERALQIIGEIRQTVKESNDRSREPAKELYLNILWDRVEELVKAELSSTGFDITVGDQMLAKLRDDSSSEIQHTESAEASSQLIPGFIYSSPAMTQLVEEIHKIRSSDVTVLVTGESGTGKELVARAIHAISSRRSKVFIPFNCTAVPKELSEGYLFGYRRGAFTGAVSDSQGVIRTAAGGTLFLDEIGDLPLDVQPKLLRLLQEGEIRPLGEQQPIKVDVRIVAATSINLEEMVTQSRFREDLYYRLNVIRLHVPPLRQRRSEIPTMVNYYISHYSSKFGRKDLRITPQVVDLLTVSDWPGNVRQLCNEIQRIVARAEDGAVITPDQLSPQFKRTSVGAFGATGVSAIASTPFMSEDVTLAAALAEVEHRMISEALRKHGGNISRAARQLGLTRGELHLHLKRFKSATGHREA